MLTPPPILSRSRRGAHGIWGGRADGFQISVFMKDTAVTVFTLLVLAVAANLFALLASGPVAIFVRST